jgi:phosphatidylserine/phosphatidylglycerophosphate/cardiolipin synthase-like enzyme
MKKHIRASLALACLPVFTPLLGCADLAQPSAGGSSTPSKISAYFSPNGGASEALVKEINAAKRELIVQAYALTSRPIALALADARKRGVAVQVILDRNQRKDKHSEAEFLARQYVLTLIDAKHAVAHSNIVIIDASTIITGSFTFTKASEENNAEDLVIIKGNKNLVSTYLRNFELHKAHSEQYRWK